MSRPQSSQPGHFAAYKLQMQSNGFMLSAANPMLVEMRHRSIIDDASEDSDLEDCPPDLVASRSHSTINTNASAAARTATSTTTTASAGSGTGPDPTSTSSSTAGTSPSATSTTAMPHNEYTTYRRPRSRTQSQRRRQRQAGARPGHSPWDSDADNALYPEWEDSGPDMFGENVFLNASREEQTVLCSGDQFDPVLSSHCPRRARPESTAPAPQSELLVDSCTVNSSKMPQVLHAYCPPASPTNSSHAAASDFSPASEAKGSSLFPPIVSNQFDLGDEEAVSLQPDFSLDLEL